MQAAFYKEDSDGVADEEDEEEDDESYEDSEEEEAPRKKAKQPLASKRQPARQAARQANTRLKVGGQLGDSHMLSMRIVTARVHPHAPSRSHEQCMHTGSCQLFHMPDLLAYFHTELHHAIVTAYPAQRSYDEDEDDDEDDDELEDLVNDDEDDEDDADDEDDDEDAEIARRLDREINGLRVRPTRVSVGVWVVRAWLHNGRHTGGRIRYHAGSGRRREGDYWEKIDRKPVLLGQDR